MNNFNSTYYKDKINDINDERSKLSELEHNIICEWKNSIDSFFDNSASEYYLMNNNTYIVLKNKHSDVLKTKGNIAGNLNSSIYWYRLQGLIIRVEENSLTGCFNEIVNIKITDEFKIVTLEEIKNVIKRKCDNLCSLDNDNINYQYKFYTSYFKETIEKYSHFFDEKMFEIISKLETMSKEDSIIMED